MDNHNSLFRPCDSARVNLQMNQSDNVPRSAPVSRKSLVPRLVTIDAGKLFSPSVSMSTVTISL